MCPDHRKCRLGVAKGKSWRLTQSTARSMSSVQVSWSARCAAFRSGCSDVSNRAWAAPSARANPVSRHIMVKGGDWVFGSLLVDEALQAVGLTRAQPPARLFCPQVVTDTGAKLSKSLIRE